MRHVHLLIVSLLLCLCSTTQAKNRVIDQPPFCVRNTTSIEVSKIVTSDTATVLHIYAKYRPKNWIRIAAGSYLKDNNGETYQLRSGIGITPDKEFWMPESGEAEFQLVFPPVAANASSIDFTEGEGIEDAFSIWGIQLKGSKLPELPLPAGAVVHKTDAGTPLPDPAVQYGKATLKGKLLGFRPGMSTSAMILQWENLKGGASEGTLNIQPDGSFNYEVALMGTAPCGIYINNLNSIQFFMEPGKTTELYINLRELSRRNSKFHSQKKPYGEAVYANGPLQVVTQELNNIQIDVNIQNKLFKDPTPFADMDANAAKERILQMSAQVQSDIDKLACSLATRQLLTINNQLGTSSSLNSIPSLLTSAAIRANRIKEENASDYYRNLLTKMPGDLISNSDLIVLNSPQSFLSDQYVNLAARSLFKSKELATAWGTDKGYFFDLAQATPITKKIKDFSPLTDEDKAALSSLPAAYREMFTAENNELLAKIEANKKKTGFTINEAGEVSNEDLFASIISKFSGKTLLVDFWATWCGPCRMANKAMIPMKEALKDKDIVYLYITGETSPMGTWQNMIPDIHGEHYRVTDAQWKYLSESFKIEGVPTYLVINPEGDIKYRATGFPGVDKMKEELLKVIK